MVYSEAVSGFGEDKWENLKGGGEETNYLTFGIYGPASLSRGENDRPA